MLRSLISRFSGRSRTSEADRLLDSACAARASGDLAGAEALLTRAVTKAPARPAARCLLAEIHLERGDAAIAEEVLRETLRLAPQDAQAHELLGKALRRRGAVLEAAQELAKAIELDRKSQSARSELAGALIELGRPDNALPLLRWLLKREPDLAGAHLNCGIALQEMGRFGDALPCFERAASLEPGNVDFLNHLAMCLRGLDRHDEAARALKRALAAAPEDAATRANLASVLREIGRPEEALALVAPLVARHAAPVEVRCAMAAALQDLGDHAGARAQYDAALEGAPDSGLARLNRAMARLAQGDFAGGWDDYEGRFDSSESPRRGFPYPEAEDAPLAGRNVLVYAEQGLGDEIMFASCVPDLIGDAARVVVECDPRLAPLFRRSFPRASVYGSPRTWEHGWLAGAGTIDVQMAAGSLPCRYRRSLASFPLHDGYLSADPARVSHYRDRLDGLGMGPKIGIAWRGGLVRTRHAVRSISPDELGPLIGRRDLHFVSVQHGAVDADLDQIRAVRGEPILHWPEAVADLDEAAALMTALDAVVTVCSSTVHLAGALGVRAHVLVPASPEWRYLAAGDRMPWYPSVRLVRQDRAGVWGPAVRAVASRF